jgi:hypothetical protein
MPAELQSGLQKGLDYSLRNTSRLRQPIATKDLRQAVTQRNYWRDFRINRL